MPQLLPLFRFHLLYPIAVASRLEIVMNPPNGIFNEMVLAFGPVGRPHKMFWVFFGQPHAKHKKILSWVKPLARMPHGGMTPGGISPEAVQIPNPKCVLYCESYNNVSTNNDVINSPSSFSYKNFSQ